MLRPQPASIPSRPTRRGTLPTVAQSRRLVRRLSASINQWRQSCSTNRTPVSISRLCKPVSGQFPARHGRASRRHGSPRLLAVSLGRGEIRLAPARCPGGRVRGSLEVGRVRSGCFSWLPTGRHGRSPDPRSWRRHRNKRIMLIQRTRRGVVVQPPGAAGRPASGRANPGPAPRGKPGDRQPLFANGAKNGVCPLSPPDVRK